MYKVGLYPEWRESIQGLSLEDKGKILENIFMYSTVGEIPHNSYIGTIFNFMKNRIDADRIEYENKCERNREIALQREKHKRTPESTNVHERAPESTTSTNSNSNSNSNIPKGIIKKQKEKKILQLQDLQKQDDSFIKPLLTREEKNNFADWMIVNGFSTETLKLQKDYFECLFHMINCGLHVKKEKVSIEQNIERIKETAKTYGYMKDGSIDRQRLLQVFNTCYERDKERGHLAEKVKSLFITFIKNNANNK